MWVGPFYPEGTSAGRMLTVYARQFLTVEAHSTHRRRPTAAALAKWQAQVPPDFRFAPKAHVGITHRRDTEGLGERVRDFLAALAPLGDRLGPVLFSLPHRQPDLPRLDLILSALGGPAPAVDPVFELASGWWIDDVFARLHDAGASLALVDRDDAPAPAPSPPRLGPVGYVRLRRSRYSGEDLAAWAVRLRAQSVAGRDVYVYVKHDEEGDGPRYARDLVSRLDAP